MITRRSAIGILGAGACAGQDWPQWRGPQRDGAAPAGNWSGKLTKVWTAPVGEGHSSPVVVGKRVVQFARQGESEVLRAFDSDSGKKLWESSYPAPYEMNPAARSHGKGPKSTPTVAANRVYTLGMSGVALASNLDGGVAWRYDSSKDYKLTAPLFGVAASPLVDGPQVIFYLGHDDNGALTSFDAATGKLRWQWKGDGPGYGSPVLVNASGARQIVVFSAQNLVGVSAADGKLLWKLPFTTPYAQNSVTPLVLGDTVIYSGLQNPVTAIKIGTSPQKLWENKDVGMYMSSPVLCGGLIYGLSHRNKGQYFALDPKTGKTVWTGEGRQGENAMLIASGATILSLTTDSELHVFQAGPRGLEPRAKHAVAQSPTWAHPALSGNQVFIKDLDSLSMWRAG